MVNAFVYNDLLYAGAYDVQEGMGEGLHRDWGSPLLDHFVTMLATLTMPIKWVATIVGFVLLRNADVQNDSFVLYRQREGFLSMLGVTKNGDG